jgi:hypothetical protein
MSDWFAYKLFKMHIFGELLLVIYGLYALPYEKFPTFDRTNYIGQVIVILLAFEILPIHFLCIIVLDELMTIMFFLFVSAD